MFSKATYSGELRPKIWETNSDKTGIIHRMKLRLIDMIRLVLNHY